MKQGASITSRGYLLRYPAAWLFTAWVLLILCAGPGCGPLESTVVILEADKALAEAEVKGAPQKAPYEYNAARAYLHKAREEQGYADYELAIDYGNKAKELARQAQLKVQKRTPAGSEGGTLTIEGAVRTVPAAP